MTADGVFQESQQRSDIYPIHLDLRCEQISYYPGACQWIMGSCITVILSRGPVGIVKQWFTDSFVGEL